MYRRETQCDYFMCIMCSVTAVIFLCAHSPSEAPFPSSFHAPRRLVRLLDGHVRDIPGRPSTQLLIQGLSKLAGVPWPEQPLKTVSLTNSRSEREALRRAARASVLASAAYSTFGVFLVAWTRSPIPRVSARSGG